MKRPRQPIARPIPLSRLRLRRCALDNPPAWRSNVEAARPAIDALAPGEICEVEVAAGAGNNRAACIMLNSMAYRAFGKGGYRIRSEGGTVRVERVAAAMAGETMRPEISA